MSGTLLLAALHSSLGNLVTWNTPSTRPPVPVEVMLEDTLEDIEVAINRVGMSSKVSVRCGAIPGCRRDCGVPVTSVSVYHANVWPLLTAGPGYATLGGH